MEVCDTNDDMGPRVLLHVLPTGKAVRFSPEMQKQAEDEARIQQEVEKRVEKRVAFMQASWLAQNQGQVGHHAQHGEAMSKFPTRPDSNQLAYCTTQRWPRRPRETQTVPRFRMTRGTGMLRWWRRPGETRTAPLSRMT